MALYTEETARANIRIRDGRRVVHLSAGDRLTPAAKEWLRQEHIDVLPAAEAAIREYETLFGAKLSQKPEHMTHLYGNVLVMKDHPRIRFRGMIDALEAEILLLMAETKQEQETLSQLREILDFVRGLIPCDVLGEAVKPWKLCGMTEEELHQHSHFPQKYYDQPHFMPDENDSRVLLGLNKIRTLVRQTELSAFEAFRTPEGNVSREDILLALNRLSSLFWVLMIRLKSKEKSHE